jgi:hypothetical protein
MQGVHPNWITLTTIAFGTLASVFRVFQRTSSRSTCADEGDLESLDGLMRSPNFSERFVKATVVSFGLMVLGQNQLRRWIQSFLDKTLSRMVSLTS